MVGLIRHGAVVIDFDAVFSGQSKYDCDFADMRGQKHAELALTIAAAGRHNVLVIGASDGYDRPHPCRPPTGRSDRCVRTVVRYADLT